MSELYEIEVKSLLGDEDNAKALRDKLVARGAVPTSENKQLNHYFVLRDKDKFKEALSPQVEKSKIPLFQKILDEGENFSVRTRDADSRVLLVVKASIGDDTSANGVSRLEFESEISMSLEELDNLLLASGLDLEAKWSRHRQEYKLGDTTVCLDKNAGYGYLAEFERVVADRSLAQAVKSEILEVMKEFGAEELPQERLERMFAYYNENWRDYYGTDKIFNIK